MVIFPLQPHLHPELEAAVQTYLDCFPCMVRQTLEAARMAGADEAHQRRIMNQALNLLSQHSVGTVSTPPEIAYQIHRLVRGQTGAEDPYLDSKQASTERALALYPRLKELVRQADDPLDAALRISIAGNIIDLGYAPSYDLRATLDRVLTQPFALDRRAALRAMMSDGAEILFLADNAGETVFDRVLIETLAVPVSYAVKGGPVLNDAARSDALEAGIDQTADIIETGSNAPGTILSQCSDDFLRRFEEADLIIAKGQANYETLSDQGARVFFLLQVKCSVIGEDIGAPVGSIVVWQGGPVRSGDAGNDGFELSDKEIS
jgi:uncharacterized protein with ATP-grasp and redox domains